MKLKLLVTILFTMPYQLFSMNDNPNIRRVEHPNGRQYFLQHPSAPEIAIEQCAHCNKAAEQRCSACKLSFYCSPECQTAHWNTHKASCNKFQSDIEHLKSAFYAYLDKAVATGEQKYVTQAMSFHLQSLIRIIQDKACAHDETISEYNTLVEHKEKLNALSEERISKEDFRMAMENAKTHALARVRQLTVANKLVPPYGVRRYGVQIFLAAKRAPDEFIPKEEWQQKRLEALDKLEEKFKNETASTVAPKPSINKEDEELLNPAGQK